MATRKSPASATDFDAVFGTLREVLSPYEKWLSVVHDTPSHYYLDTHTLGKNKKPIMFGAVRVMKNYVSYYFMPIYGVEQRGISPALKKHMQGKACFNFTSVDAALFAELELVTKQGWDDWKALGWV